ncbi:DUF6230 family protein [Streptomyces sp. NPDC007205]|uniref:DUF6230 family protein n=1 Tax=Streptomyces sp. NPDC007205 TaxID=3154316 RepID=UPI00340C568F
MRFVVALTPMLVGASVLLAGSAAGMVSVAFAGQVPLTVHAERVSGSNVTAVPGVSGRGGVLPALVTRLEKGEVKDACATSTAQLPIVGPVTVTVRIRRASAAGLSVETDMATAESVTLTGARLNTPQTSLQEPTGLFSVGAQKVDGRQVMTQPHAFTAGTITAHGIDIAVSRGSGDCHTRGKEKGTS